MRIAWTWAFPGLSAFAKSTLTSLATTAVVGIYFIVKMPSMPGLEVAQGMILFVAAIVLGAVTPIRALRA